MTITFECTSNDGSSVTLRDGLSEGKLSIDSVDRDGSAETHISAENRPLVALAALPHVANAYLAASLAETYDETYLIEHAATHLLAVMLRREKAVKNEALTARRNELAEQFAGSPLFDRCTAGLQEAINHIISTEVAA